MVSDGTGVGGCSSYNLRGMGAGSTRAGVGVWMFNVGMELWRSWMDPYDELLFAVHIQANLEDELVKEALKTVRFSTILICPSTYPPLREKKKKTISCSSNTTLVSYSLVLH